MKVLDETSAILERFSLMVAGRDALKAFAIFSLDRATPDLDDTLGVLSRVTAISSPTFVLTMLLADAMLISVVMRGASVGKSVSAERLSDSKSKSRLRHKTKEGLKPRRCGPSTAPRSLSHALPPPLDFELFNQSNHWKRHALARGGWNFHSWFVSEDNSAFESSGARARQTGR